jgi:hypothetical protein
MLVPLTIPSQTDAINDIDQKTLNTGTPYNYVYDLAGRKVYGMGEGIYIKNGRKIGVCN